MATSISEEFSRIGGSRRAYLGQRVGEWSEEIGAAVLVLVGVAIAAGLFT